MVAQRVRLKIDCAELRFEYFARCFYDQKFRTNIAFMNKIFHRLVIVAANCLLGACIGWADHHKPMSADQIKDLRSLAKTLTGTIPEKMPGAENDSPARIALGKTLYFDTLFSENRKISCNSCHQVDKNGAGVDGKPASPGAFGEFGDRNSPTVLNAGFHIAQFWDGRAATLEDQAKGPVLNPVEMAMPSVEVVLERINQSAKYKKMFTEAFPDASDSVSYDNMAKAIASFERTLITEDRYDDFLDGDDKALSNAELKGLKSFIETGCITCHNGPLLGGNTYQKVGLVNPYKNNQDLGRYKLTNKEEDKFMFKVPSLRNVALTGPYLHDGSIFTLAEVIRQMAWLQLGRQVSDLEANDIQAFLKTLSDKERGRN